MSEAPPFIVPASAFNAIMEKYGPVIGGSKVVADELLDPDEEVKELRRQLDELCGAVEKAGLGTCISTDLSEIDGMDADDWANVEALAAKYRPDKKAHTSE